MIDELNIIKKNSKKEIVDYAKWFGEMNLSDDEIDERIELANKLETDFAFILALIFADKLNDEMRGNDYYSELLARMYGDTVVGFYDDDEYNEDTYMYQYIHGQSKLIVDTTVLHIADGYYTSEGRAVNMAANETNAVANYYRDIKALKQGYTYKKWVTKHDPKVRHTHREADGQQVKILEPFKVGKVRMMFPLDKSIDGEDANVECINCRCTVDYSGKKEELSNEEVEKYNYYKANTSNGNSYYIKGGIKKVNKHAEDIGIGDFNRNVNPDIAEALLQEKEKAEVIFGKFNVKSISALDSRVEYDGIYENGRISIKNIVGDNALVRLKTRAMEMFNNGEWSTSSPYHTIRHEYAHAIIEKQKMMPGWSLKEQKIDAIMQSIKSNLTGNIKLDRKYLASQLSEYGMMNIDDFMAEAIAEYLNGKKCRSVASQVVSVLLGV